MRPPLGALCLSRLVWGFSLAFATSIVDAQETQTYVTTTNVNVRSGPGTEHAVITTLKPGTKVNVAGREREWLKVVSKRGNPPGYINGKYVRPIERQIAEGKAFVPRSYVTIEEVSVRQGPGITYETVAVIPRETRIHVVGTEGEWLKIESKSGKPPGYIQAKSARPS